MGTLILQTHGLVRWLVLIAGLLVILRAGWGWFSNLSYEKPDNILGAAFTGLVDLNVLLGIIVFIALASAIQHPAAEIHAAIMIVSAVIAHVARRLSRSREGKVKHLFQGVGVLVTFVLILVGIQFVT